MVATHALIECGMCWVFVHPVAPSRQCTELQSTHSLPISCGLVPKPCARLSYANVHYPTRATVWLFVTVMD